MRRGVGTTLCLWASCTEFQPPPPSLALIGATSLQSEFKRTPITAVTATATAAVQADILSTLGITKTVTVHQVCVCVLWYCACVCACCVGLCWWRCWARGEGSE